MNRIVLGFPNLNESPINEPDTTLELGHIMGNFFSFLLARPSNLVTNRLINVGSNENCMIHIANLLQFHMKASYTTTLSCFIYKMDWSKYWSKVSLINHPSKMWTSLLDFTWAWMVGTTKTHNFSTSNKLKFVQVLNKPRVVHIVSNTYGTPTLWSID